jgi:hypothetical protein
MFKVINDFIKQHPIASSQIALVLGVVLHSAVLSSNPLEPKPLEQYRVVYEHTKERYTSCSGETGFFWFSEVLDEGIFFDTWKSSGYCADTEEQAKDQVEKIIKKRLETEASKKRVYQAWLTKEDVIKFTTEGEEL